MTAIEIAQQYFDRWNSRDPAAVLATFVEGGTYSDPASDGPLSGEIFAAYVGGLISAFPDLSFDVISMTSSDDGMVAAQWLMKGTNSGPFRGGPPTGQSVALPGADFFTFEGDKIRSVQGYIDQKAFSEQLGLQVIIQPRSIGNFEFGTSVRNHTGQLVKPGAYSITVIQTRSDEESGRIMGYGQAILQEMAEMPGYISAVLGSVGDRMFTMTAWTDPESPRQLMRRRTHRTAMDDFFGPDLSGGGVFSVWVPVRITTMWVRCTTCGQMSDNDWPDGKCENGHELPEHIAYW